VPTLVVGTLDGLLADFLVAGARRRWPRLCFVPRRWMRPLLMPTARHLRRSLARATVLVSLAVLAIGAALVLPW
jgi:hypothetical protein